MPLAVDIRAALQGLLLFSDLTGPELEQLVPLFRLVEAKAGDQVIREGESVRSLLFVISGEAAVMKGTLGKRAEIALVGKRTVLGEMSLLENVLASASIEAKGPFQALAVDRIAFNQAMDKNPVLGYKILKKLVRLMSARLRTTSEDLTERLIQ